jgi:hypothetical protein
VKIKTVAVINIMQSEKNTTLSSFSLMFYITSFLSGSPKASPVPPLFVTAFKTDLSMEHCVEQH